MKMNMTESKEINGQYLGREYMNSKGVDKNGKTWKRYKLKFACQVAGGKTLSLSFTAFDQYCKGFDQVEEGEYYRVVYEAEERTNQSGQTYISKTARELNKTDTAINSPADQTALNEKSPQEQATGALGLNVKVPIIEVLTDFLKKYPKIDEYTKEMMCFATYFMKVNEPDNPLWKHIRSVFEKKVDKDLGELI